MTNHTGADALLAAWIDSDDDGTFEPDELATATVPDGADETTLNWSGLSTTKPGTTFARLRLFGDKDQDKDQDDSAGLVATALPDAAAISPTGFGGPGEVEDHKVRIEPVQPKVTDPLTRARPVPPARDPIDPLAPLDPRGTLPGTGSSDHLLHFGIVAAFVLSLGALFTALGRPRRRTAA